MNRTNWLNSLESANFFGTDDAVPTIRALFDHFASDDAHELTGDKYDVECHRASIESGLHYNLTEDIKNWREENPDATGIWPQVDLSSMTVIGTQDAYSSWDGSTGDTSDWEIVYMGPWAEDVAVRVTS